MLLKAFSSFALVVLMIPREPDVGLGRPEAFGPSSKLALLHANMLSRIDEVRQDIKDQSAERR